MINTKPAEHSAIPPHRDSAQLPGHFVRTTIDICDQDVFIMQWQTTMYMLVRSLEYSNAPEHSSFVNELLCRRSIVDWSRVAFSKILQNALLLFWLSITMKVAEVFNQRRKVPLWALFSVLFQTHYSLIVTRLSPGYISIFYLHLKLGSNPRSRCFEVQRMERDHSHALRLRQALFHESFRHGTAWNSVRTTFLA